MTQRPTIFKRDSKGKVREWRMEIDGNKYRTIAGLQDGQQVTSEWTVVEGKNVGRANETTPELQAISEVESHYEKKLKVDYHESLDNIDVAKIYKPMLAKKWDDRKAKIDYSGVVHVQPKLDGIRCIAMKEGLFSRTGKPIVSVPHIYKALAPIFEKYPDAVFDGELYNHNLRDDFNSIVSMVRKAKPTADDFKLAKDVVQYHIYDFPSMGADDFSVRFDKLVEILLAYKTIHVDSSPLTSNDSIQIVDTFLCNDEETVDLRYAEALAQGFEGGIIRIDGPYEQKRSSLLLKRKDFEDDEFEIVGIEEGSGNWSGHAKVCVYTIPGVTDNVPYADLPKATIQGSRDYTLHVLENIDSYIGKQVTVQYFNLTPDGIPRFPIAKVLHEDKRW